MLYKLLHNIEDGGGARAFECCVWDATGAKSRTCGKITRTKIGMKMHVWRVHGIREQGELWQSSAANERKITANAKHGAPKPDSTASGTTPHAANERSHGQ